MTAFVTLKTSLKVEAEGESGISNFVTVPNDTDDLRGSFEPLALVFEPAFRLALSMEFRFRLVSALSIELLPKLELMMVWALVFKCMF